MVRKSNVDISYSDHFSPNRFKTYTGGVLDTNSYLYESPSGARILFDAPQGAARAYRDERIDALVLTHGHFDHVADAAALLARHGCPSYCHAQTVPMVTDRDFFRRWGFELEIEPFTPTHLLEECPLVEVAGVAMQTFHVPGHSPDSLCFYFQEEGVLVGGDVLFYGGVGRWDLPGGNGDLLFQGIKSKLFPLPDSVIVLPGHGPATTIGREKSENPFLQV